MHKFLPILIIAGLLIAIFSYMPLKQQVFYKLGVSNDKTTSCCNIDEIVKSNGSFDEGATTAIFNNEVIDYPKTSLAANFNNKNNDTQVLGTVNAQGEEKWIDISLDEQKLRAYEGNRVVIEFPVSSGLWFPTPKGEFSIWYKTRAQRMTGGNRDIGTFYDLPNVPHNMFFYQGFAIHGAYWHNNFGHPMSHGCVNSPLASAAQLFEWSGPVVPENQGVVRASPENPGTRVVVH
ncbi:MAG: L,D-transpeptidase [Candidatus Daviesbacteria bacterium]|nr:L,D-transpeptidase [Candidatus Daviesbacteria bacterium]